MRHFMQLFLLSVVMSVFTTLAFGQDGSPVANLLPFLKDWPTVIKVLGFMFALQVFLRGVSEALIKLSDVLDPGITIDNKLAGWCSEAAWVLGVVLSKVGYGVPTDVALEKAKNVIVGPEVKKS